MSTYIFEFQEEVFIAELEPSQVELLKFLEQNDFFNDDFRCYELPDSYRFPHKKQERK